MDDCLFCPGCGSAMRKNAAADFTSDECAACGGIFLDKGELNALASEMSGDIEYCSLDGGDHGDRGTRRQCPRCPGVEMHAIALLAVSDITFDACPQCHGFFLDKGEAESMNAVLHRISGAGGAHDYRGQIRGRLVRYDVLRGSSLNTTMDGLHFAATPTLSVTLTAFFSSPLGIGLRVDSEKWADKLRKMLRIFKYQDILVGEPQLDSRYVIQGTDKTRVAAILCSEAVKRALISFHRNRPKIFTEPGQLVIHDDRVEYIEGPYTGREEQICYDVEADSKGVVEILCNLATAFDSCGQ